MKDITLVITSCNRLDLLDRTLASIGTEVLDAIKHKIIVDDSGDSSVCEYFSKFKKEEGWQILINDENIGQPKSVDKAYSHVTTPFVFHCEDDWFFESPINFEACIDILESDEKLLQVTFRKDSPHPESKESFRSKGGFEYHKFIEAWRGIWWGFTYNPSIFRMSAYAKLGSHSGMDEQTISKRYHDLGYKSASLLSKSYYHIGDGRTTGSHLKL